MIDPMTPNDAVNEGLLAGDDLPKILEGWAKGYRDHPECRFPSDPDAEFFPVDLERAAAALRAVPSPDTVGVREALEYALGALRTIAASGKDASPSQLAAIARAGIDLASKGASACAEMRGDGAWSMADALTDENAAAINAALSPSHCTAGRREEIARIWLRATWFDGDVAAFEHCGDHPEWLAALKGADALLAFLTSEQSGPTAGREAAIARNYWMTIDESKGMLRANAKAFGEAIAKVIEASPPDRQQDQDENSVLPRGASAEPVADDNDDKMWKISALIADLQSVLTCFGDTCVYVRRGGLSWGAVALNRRSDDEKHGVFDLQAQHDRDMTARLEQIERLKKDRGEWRQKVWDASASPPVSDASREAIKNAIRTFCRSLGAGSIQMSHGVERIYYSGISLEALSVAVVMALSPSIEDSE